MVLTCSMARVASMRLLACTLLCAIACSLVVCCNLGSCAGKTTECIAFQLPDKRLKLGALGMMVMGWILTTLFAASRFARWANQETEAKTK